MTTSERGKVPKRDAAAAVHAAYLEGLRAGKGMSEDARELYRVLGLMFADEDADLNGGDLVEFVGDVLAHPGEYDIEYLAIASGLPVGGGDDDED